MRTSTTLRVPAARRRTSQASILTNLLLDCGIVATVLYVAANVITVLAYPGYEWTSQTVSELSAIDAPTRSIWNSLMLPYGLLMFAFGWGVWLAAGRNRLLRFAAVMLLVGTIVGAFWPPMHQREVLAAGGGTMTDTLHIAFTAFWAVFSLCAMIATAKAIKGTFGFFTFVAVMVLIVFGALTGLASPDMEKNLPTPMIGVWERVNMAAYFLWVMVLAFVLIARKPSP